MLEQTLNALFAQQGEQFRPGLGWKVSPDGFHRFQGLAGDDVFSEFLVLEKSLEESLHIWQNIAFHLITARRFNWLPPSASKRRK